MPRRDGTGPMGIGPTGWGFGNCVGINPGCRLGKERGMGMGFGMSFGRRANMGFTPEILEKRADILKQQAEQMRKNTNKSYEE